MFHESPCLVTDALRVKSDVTIWLNRLNVNALESVCQESVRRFLAARRTGSGKRLPVSALSGREIRNFARNEAGSGEAQDDETRRFA